MATICLLIISLPLNLFAQVGIADDGSLPDSRVILDVKSNDKGVLLPRLSQAQRNSLFQDVPNGMLIFNSSTNQFQVFINNNWYPLQMGIPEAAPAQPIMDGDGNTYTSVVIGTQTWLRENLKTTSYNDGTPIANVTNNVTWAGLTSPAYCWYNNDAVSYKNLYGALYNWYVVDAASNGYKNVCPVGWHVPSDDEWTQMENYLADNGHNYDGTTGGGASKIAKSLASTSGWSSSSVTGAAGNTDYPAYRNKSGFTALPGGIRYENGTFVEIGLAGYWWSTMEDATTTAWNRGVTYNYRDVTRVSCHKEVGFSVRCVKD